MMDVVFGWPPTYESLHMEPDTKPGASIWFVFRGGQLLVAQGTQGGMALPPFSDPAALGIESIRSHYLGTLSDLHCYTVEAPGALEEAPPGWEWQPLRRLHGAIDSDLYALAGRALQLIEWERTHCYCGACGAETVRKPTERARECSNCGMVYYPRVTPVIMALVKRGRQILLARGPHPAKHWSNASNARYSKKSGCAPPMCAMSPASRGLSRTR